MNKLLDANAILRYLLNDIEEQAIITEKAINNGAFTISEVLCEVVYVLKDVYELNKIEISNTLLEFIDRIDINDKKIIKSSLILFKDSKLDFVDCILLSRNSIYGDQILSFDKKLNKIINE